MESIVLLHGKVIFSIIRKRDFDFYGINSSDLDGIIDQLRVTEGIECAILLYEKEDGNFKVSMRSNDAVDVSAIAQILVVVVISKLLTVLCMDSQEISL